MSFARSACFWSSVISVKVRFTALVIEVMVSKGRGGSLFLLGAHAAILSVTEAMETGELTSAIAERVTTFKRVTRGLEYKIN